MVNITCQPLCHQKWTAVTIESEARWSPEPVLTFGGREKPFTLAGVRWPLNTTELENRGGSFTLVSLRIMTARTNKQVPLKQ
jgi:hypothetical protein